MPGTIYTQRLPCERLCVLGTWTFMVVPVLWIRRHGGSKRRRIDLVSNIADSLLLWQVFESAASASMAMFLLDLPPLKTSSVSLLHPKREQFSSFPTSRLFKSEETTTIQTLQDSFFFVLTSACL